MTLFVLCVGTILFVGSAPLAIAIGALFGLMCSMTAGPRPTSPLSSWADEITPPIMAGMLSLFFGLGCAFGPVVAGAIFDATGSYNTAGSLSAPYQ